MLKQYKSVYVHVYLTTGVTVRQNMRSNLQITKYLVRRSFPSSYGKSETFVVSVVTGKQSDKNFVFSFSLTRPAQP